MNKVNKKALLTIKCNMLVSKLQTAVSHLWDIYAFELTVSLSQHLEVQNVLCHSTYNNENTSNVYYNENTTLFSVF